MSDYRKVKMKLEITVLVEVLSDSTPEEIEFHFNESSHCTDNEIGYLTENREEGSCNTCSVSNFTYLGEPTDYELEELPKAYYVEPSPKK